MAKTDFTRTSEQVERDTLGLIEKVERSLETSTSESERKGQLIFGAILSVIVFFSILAFEYFVGTKASAEKSEIPKNIPERISHKEMKLIESNIARIENELALIESTKARVAPAMPIDSNTRNIRNSIQDIKSIIETNPINTPASEKEN